MDFLLTLLLIPFAAPLVLGFVNMCCCVAGCTYFSDDFSTDRLSTDYDQRAGTWTVSGGLLSTSSSSALVVSTTTFPGASQSTLYMTTTVDVGSTSDVARIVFNRTDDNNYWFAEVQCGTPPFTQGTLKLFSRSAGVNTQEGTTQTVIGFSTSVPVVIRICVYADVIRVNAKAGSNSTGTLAVSSILSLNGTTCGVATGAVASSVTFDDLSLEKTKLEDDTCNTCSEACSCQYCSNGSEGGAPCEMQIDFDGVLDGSCSTCEDLNGTWIFTGISHPTGTCTWDRDLGDGCSLGNCTLAITEFIVGDGMFITVGFATIPSTPVHQYSQATGKQDCFAFDGFNVPDANVNSTCDWRTATCLLTAI